MRWPSGASMNKLLCGTPYHELKKKVRDQSGITGNQNPQMRC